MSIPFVSYAEKVKELDISDPVKRIKAASELRRMLDRIASEQRFLASSFLHTGNRDVAGQLYEAVESIEAIAEKWSEIESKDVRDRLADAQQHSVNLLETALAVCSKRKGR